MLEHTTSPHHATPPYRDFDAKSVIDLLLVTEVKHYPKGAEICKEGVALVGLKPHVWTRRMSAQDACLDKTHVCTRRMSAQDACLHKTHVCTTLPFAIALG